MTTVITGATGMIGGEIRVALEVRSQPVRVLSRQPSERHGFILLPRHEAPDSDFETVLAGASAVIHCAALNSDAGRADAESFMAANALLTEKLARAAAKVVPGPFVFLSSTRAVLDAWESATITVASEPRPTSPYGRSKLEGERRLLDAYAKADRADAFVLRLPPVYGPGMRGMLGALARLARSPLPSPFGSLRAPLSLVSSESAAWAALALAGSGTPAGQVHLACDRHPTCLAEAFAALRAGFGRRLLQIPVPPQLLRLAGQGEKWRQLTASQVCEPSNLAALGWVQEEDTPAALKRLAAKIAVESR